jgi:hypothetical protein
MESHKLVIKLFTEGGVDVAADAVVPVFHSWIRDQAMPDHLLIDVADYAHVPNGPGTVLVAHEANIHFDREDAKPGLQYVRKQPLAGAMTFRERLFGVVRYAMEAAEKLESDPTLGARMNANDILFRINDRLLGPNDQATYDAIKDDLQNVFGSIYNGELTLEYKPDSERRLEVRIRSAKRVTVKDLLSRLRPQTTPSR